MTEFSLKLIFIFLPGIVSLVISERLTSHPGRKGYDLVVYALVIGCLSHMTYDALRFAVHTLPQDDWLDAIVTSNFKIQGVVAAISTLIGAAYGFGLAYAANHSLLHRFARFIGVSKRFSDLDVWNHLMNSPDLEWVVIRDQAKDLMYQGSVSAFSDEEDQREVLLANAAVFQNSTSEKLYDVALLYLSFDRKNIVLEIQQLGEQHDN